MDVSYLKSPPQKTITLIARSVQFIRSDELLCVPRKELPQTHLPHHGTAPPNDVTPMPNIIVQTSPVVGISFCLIIVRLGAIAPDVREDSWEYSQRSRPSRMLPFSDPQASKLPVPLDRIKVERNVYVNEFQGDAMEFRVMGPTPPDGKRAPVR